MVKGGFILALLASVATPAVAGDSPFWGPFAIHAGASLVDAASTEVMLANGGRERNPLGQVRAVRWTVIPAASGLLGVGMERGVDSILRHRGAGEKGRKVGKWAVRGAVFAWRGYWVVRNLRVGR